MKAEDMEKRLKSAFPDSEMVISDLTGTENHYEVRIASAKFEGQTRLNRQRMVMDTFSDELKSGELHALTIQTLVK